jgi:hypothetical protein
MKSRRTAVPGVGPVDRAEAGRAATRLDRRVSTDARIGAKAIDLPRIASL